MTGRKQVLFKGMVEKKEYGVRSLFIKWFFDIPVIFNKVIFSTLWGHRVENLEFVYKVFLQTRR